MRRLSNPVDVIRQLNLRDIVIISLLFILAPIEARARISFWQIAAVAASGLRQEAYVKSSPTSLAMLESHEAEFGYAVRVNGDALAVGAYGEDSIAT